MRKFKVYRMITTFMLPVHILKQHSPLIYTGFESVHLEITWSALCSTIQSVTFFVCILCSLYSRPEHDCINTIFNLQTHIFCYSCLDYCVLNNKEIKPIAISQVTDFNKIPTDISWLQLSSFVEIPWGKGHVLGLSCKIQLAVQFI